jgi:hypothetical protein
LFGFLLRYCWRWISILHHSLLMLLLFIADACSCICCYFFSPG